MFLCSELQPWCSRVNVAGGLIHIKCGLILTGASAEMRFPKLPF